MSVLFAGVVGASLVFVLGVLREEWRDDREGVGILRLLLAEIEYNIAVIQTLDHWRVAEVVDIDMRLLPHMKTEVWHSVRVRAAQLLPKELTTALNDYYSPLDKVLTIREVQEDPEKLDLSNHVMMDALGILAERQYTAPPVLYRDYAVLVPGAQNFVHKKIEDRLALPAWRRYPFTGQLERFVIWSLRSRKGEKR